ncbi:MAGa3780 family membrane protein [Mycoplasma sp. CSL7503-lung]|uniref:MAGa3780 family membrane protein n=1 Tax=Mycoplasma sp. CSL7503-lung TaxID=536372 RepID=UPI0037CC3450
MCFSTKNIIRRLFFHSLILISITFLVYWGLISWTSNWKNIFESYKSLHTHLINPMIIFIFAFIWKDKLKIPQKDKFICLIYVFSYFIFAFLLFISTYYLEYNKEHGVVIYSFLNFFHPFFYKGNNLDLKLTLNFIIILIGIGLPILIFKFWYRILSINKKLDI